MLVDGSIPPPPPWTTGIQLDGANVLIDRFRFVLRVEPELVVSDSMVNEIVGLVTALSPVPVALRFFDRLGSIVFDILQDYDVATLLAHLDAVIRPLLPAGAVRYLQPDRVHVAMAPPNDEFAGDWPYAKIRAVPAWEVEPGANSQVTIGVIDTGIVLNDADQINHPDFTGSRFDLGTNFISPQLKPRDDNSHGTLVSGIAMAGRDNFEGIPGMTSGTRAHICKTLRDDAYGNESDFGGP